MSGVRTCRVCGCTDDRACVTEAGPCSWVSADLCSACSLSSYFHQTPARMASTPTVPAREPRTTGETRQHLVRGSHPKPWPVDHALGALPRFTVQRTRLCQIPVDPQPRDAHRALTGDPHGTGEHRRGRARAARGRAGP